MSAPIPPLRPRPLRTMVDMGMDMRHGHDMDMSGGGHGMECGGMSHGGGWHGTACRMAATATAARHGREAERSRRQHDGGGRTRSSPVTARTTTAPATPPSPTVQRNRLGEPGTGLEDVGHRVLVYTDLVAARPYDQRPPERELELHLTGNMDRYMWSFDGKKFSEVKSPIPFSYGERLRLIMVNDTMMEHPIHLHGMWMQLENGHGALDPAQAHHQRQAGRAAVGADHRRRAGTVGVPLPPALPHGDGDVPRRRGHALQGEI